MDLAFEEAATIATIPSKHQQFEGGFREEDTLEMVQENLSSKVLYLGPHLVGMKSRVKKVESWLRADDGQRNDNVCILVICGMGGLGKTTIAKSIFNSNYARFDGSSFLSNIREASKIPKGLLGLQRQLLADITKKPEKKIHSIDDGLRRILYFLKNKRILLVLDDVDDVEQLEAILGMRNWFMEGSKILITSRRDDLLKAHENYVVYRIDELDYEESLELFSRHAFGRRIPVEGFLKHSRRFVNYCQGLPLALEVLGSSVYKRDLTIWDNTLASLELIPEAKILEKLKISFDSLSNKDQQLFLDVACFFVGSDKNDAIAILDRFDYYVALGIQKLVDRNLLSVGENNKLRMHRLIQDMAKQVVCEESGRPEKRTRLFNHHDSFNVLKNKTGSANVEGLILDMNMLKKRKVSSINMHRPLTSWPYWINPTKTNQDDEITLETESFNRMYNLRLLKLSNVKLSGSYNKFPQDLRLLCLRGFHLKSLPNGFPLDYIVSLDLRNSSLTNVLWKETKVLETMKILNLSHCHQLTKTPNFLTVPNLEKLILKDCPCLYEINESILVLERLILLNLKNCKNLKKLPRNICLVKSLEQLIISGCSNLVGVSEELVKMNSLKGLFADRIAIHQLLVSSPQEVAPRYLLPWLRITKPVKNPETSWVSLPKSLVNLSLTDSNLANDAFPKDFGNLPFLEYLNLRGNPICRLPDFIRKLGRLQKLDLSWCSRLEEIEWPEVNVNELIVTECRSLQRVIYQTAGVGPKCISHGACTSLNYVEGGFKIEFMRNVDASVLENIGFLDFETYKNDDVLIVNKIVWSRKKLPVQVIYESNIFNTYFYGNEVPDFFTNKSSSCNVLSFTIPSTSSHKIRGLNMCVVYTLPTDIEWFKDPISISISNKSKGRDDYTYTPRCFGVQENDENLIWISHWFWDLWGKRFEEGDEAEVCFNMNVNGKIKECGINLLYYKEGGVQQYYKALLSSWHSGTDSVKLLQCTTCKYEDEINEVLQFLRCPSEHSIQNI